VILDDFAEYVEVPGFGKVGRYGNGILLFEPGPRGNKLVLLADTPFDVSYLLDALSSGALYSCLLQETIGVCSIGFGGTFSELPPSFFDLTPTTTPFSEPGFGEATPTPDIPGD
jgi:hypothetical protein